MEQQKKFFTGLRKQTDNPFLNMYEMDAIDGKGKHFGYYFATRNRDGMLKCQTGITRSCGVAIYALVRDCVSGAGSLENEAKNAAAGGAPEDRLVVIRQYRYPIAGYLYEIPAGLIDRSETAADAAVREIREETGLDLQVYYGGNPAARKAFYIAQGMSDESNEMVFGTAAGNVKMDKLEASERIEVVLADRKEAKRILCEEEVSIRCAFALMTFLNMKGKNPFAFLEF